MIQDGQVRPWSHVRPPKARRLHPGPAPLTTHHCPRTLKSGVAAAITPIRGLPYRRSASGGPRMMTETLSAGVQALKRGDAPGALPYLERACRDRPDDFRAHVALGVAYG